MEAFSLLKYWKSTSGNLAAPPQQLPLPTTTTTTTTVLTSDTTSNAADDDGPFFDLEFAVPTEDDDNDNDNDNDEEEDDYEDEDNLKEDRETEIDEHDDDDEDENAEDDVEERELEPDLTFSPSDDLFFKGRILRFDGSEEMINSSNKTGQFAIPVSLVKSATKFRVFLLGLKRSKSESKQNQNQNKAPENQHASKKLFTVKFKVEEVPIFSLLTRASSNSKVNSNTSINKEEEQEGEEQQKLDGLGSNSECSGDEKKNKKEVVQKYLKMVKPLYVKVSKKKQRATVERREKMAEKQGLNLKVIAKKHLGKSKSAVVHSMVQQNTTSSKRRDDSLLQQQDGIQSAILHCKRSFNSSKDFLDGEEASSLLLSQLVNDSLNEQKATVVVAAATMEEKQNGVVAA
ncbi:probable membrane-associated kinase regulator 2 [Beta vulgaris subsp. vulgaris]|uniref:probable membrane-associated kinase regulator 2 n=1 Tax=Beta vulgaris subsp. vulgaris TaxID=3555 RepID=UPI0020369CB3|nr:probable membrane-associated kinase regulator 2 [Beta vulgaris subsp. vulgaris]